MFEKVAPYPYIVEYFTDRSLNIFKFSMRAMSLSTNVLTQDQWKKLTVEEVVECIERRMVLGLGMGSTTTFSMARIGEMKDIPTSKHTVE